jgi:hypothetical protein
MKLHRTGVLALASCLLLLNPLLTLAQSTAEEKSKAEAHAEAKAEARAEKVTPLKVQVVLAEFDGDKKVKSMPYVSYLNAYEGGRGGSAKLRIGARVPVYTGKDAGMQYIDVGTNIDCRATSTLGDAGNYHLDLVVERSWVESDVLIPVAKISADDKSESLGQFKEPVIHQFRTEMGVSLHDGQTSESTLATDPLSGRVSKIEVTLSLLK